MGGGGLLWQCLSTGEVFRGGRQSEGWKREEERERLCVLGSFKSQRKWRESVYCGFHAQLRQTERAVSRYCKYTKREHKYKKNPKTKQGLTSSSVAVRKHVSLNTVSCLKLSNLSDCCSPALMLQLYSVAAMCLKTS